MSNSNLPPVYDLKSLRATKVYLQARSNTKRKEIDARLHRIKTLGGLLEREDDHTLLHSVTNKAFNIMFNVLVARQSRKFGFIKSMLLRSQAQIIKKPLQGLFGKLSDLVIGLFDKKKQEENLRQAERAGQAQ